MKKKKKIAVITGARAEYGLLKPLMKKIQASDDLNLELIVTGLHLLKKFGLTVNDIKKDGFKISANIPMYAPDDSAENYYGTALARGIGGFTQALIKLRPDILIVLGDRLEALAAVLAAATLGIPIGHIHGGDKTDSGHIDESIRHAITRFSQLHFPATAAAEKRLIKMGEQPERIFSTGALGAENIINSPKISRQTLFKKFQLATGQKLILCIFHPVNLEYKQAGGQMREILSALKQLKIQSIVIYPNNDLGAEDIIKEIDNRAGSSFIKAYPNLNQADYLNLLKQADVLIGNSSSGIIEAPALGLPAVNIGSRNTGREHGKNVIFSSALKKEIVKAINRALYDKKFINCLKKQRNPYGRTGASDKIIKILAKTEINKKLLSKKITY